MPGYVTLGTDVETGQPIWIGDIERCGGLYVLGKPRTGKSNLLISLALQDFARGIGGIFIDPHADAVQAILDRMPGNRINDVIVLDPTHPEYAFGINPLYCHNPHDLRERQLSFGQTWDVFAKAFAEDDERLGILLSKYLGNCLYPLIEHQGYTLYDLWYFLHDQSFRDSVLRKVTHHPEVLEFWYDDYEKLMPRLKIEEPRSLLNRIDSLRRNPYIKHVISQAHSSIDFVKVMEENKIVLLRMPPWQDRESQTFIGTLVISQLLKAIFLRADVSEHLRTPFAIYCDEFQMFATPDFAKLFTQTGKYRVMPAVAHQDRVGQFKPNDPNRGATLVALHKVFFSTSVPDSGEVAPEVAKPSPTEIKLQKQLVISHEPFADLLRGHKNPDMHRFIENYLRPLQFRLEDTRDDIEGERLLRLAILDEAALSRVDERYEALEASTMERGRNFTASYAALQHTEQLLVQTQAQTERLRRLHDSARHLRLSIRSLNTFLTAIMEGRIRPEPGQELFSHFLLAFVRLCTYVPSRAADVFGLYISLHYGNPRLPRTLPVAFAAKYQLTNVEEVYHHVETEYQRRVLAISERNRRKYEEDIGVKNELWHDWIVKKMFTWKHLGRGSDFSLKRNS